MINYYEIEVKGKNINHFLDKVIASKINIYDITYKKNEVVFKISYEDYLKIKKIKTIYEVTIVKVNGLKKAQKLIKFYQIYIFFFFVSLIFVYVFSCLILKIRVNTDNEELKKTILEELKNQKVTLFTFTKSFKRRQIIANKIKENHQDLINFIEIKRTGVVYEISIIERITKNKNENSIVSNLVASKNGLILDMNIKSGEILKNKGDYVSKGEVIVSGKITKNGEIKNFVEAIGNVYAETWYKVKITYPKKVLIQKNEIGETKLKLVLFNKELTFLKFKNKKLKQEKIQNLFKNNVFSFILEKKFKENLIEESYDKKEIINRALDIAQIEITKNLSKNEKILFQKTLKIVEYDDRIYVEVFFKVYEDIADKKEILE